MIEAVEATQAVRRGEARDANLRGSFSPRRNREPRIRRNRITMHGIVDQAGYMTHATANSIHQALAEDVRLFCGKKLTPGKDRMHGVAKGISLLLRTGVKEVGRVDGILRAEALIKARDDVVLVGGRGKVDVETCDAYAAGIGILRACRRRWP